MQISWYLRRNYTLTRIDLWPRCGIYQNMRSHLSPGNINSIRSVNGWVRKACCCHTLVQIAANGLFIEVRESRITVNWITKDLLRGGILGLNLSLWNPPKKTKNAFVDLFNLHRQRQIGDRWGELFYYFTASDFSTNEYPLYRKYPVWKNIYIYFNTFSKCFKLLEILLRG